MSANTSKNPCECSICHIVITRKGDMPRHMKTHAVNKQQHTHKCPWPECKYENLQRSNVDTHLRTHSNDKSKICPNCEFRTCDPGSLTRHRKRIHGYVPKPRKSRGVSKTSNKDEPSESNGTQRPKPKSGTSRHHPYLRESTVESTVESTSSYEPSSAPSPTPTHISDDVVSVTAYPVLLPSFSLPAELDGLLTFPDSPICSPKAHEQLPNLFHDSSKDVPTYWDSETIRRFFHGPWPKPLYPASETTCSLQNYEPAQPYSSAETLQLLAESRSLSAPESCIEVLSYVDLDMNKVPPQEETAMNGDFYSSSNFTSGWEDLDYFKIDSLPRISARSSTQWPSWSLAQPPLECMETFNASPILMLPSDQVPSLESTIVPEAHYQCMFEQGFSLGFDDSLVGADSPAWSSPCSSPGSSSPIPFSCEQDEMFPDEMLPLGGGLYLN